MEGDKSTATENGVSLFNNFLILVRVKLNSVAHNIRTARRSRTVSLLCGLLLGVVLLLTLREITDNEWYSGDYYERARGGIYNTFSSLRGFIARLSLSDDTGTREDDLKEMNLLTESLLKRGGAGHHPTMCCNSNNEYGSPSMVIFIAVERGKAGLGAALDMVDKTKLSVSRLYKDWDTRCVGYVVMGYNAKSIAKVLDRFGHAPSESKVEWYYYRRGSEGDIKRMDYFLELALQSYQKTPLFVYLGKGAAPQEHTFELLMEAVKEVREYTTSRSACTSDPSKNEDWNMIRMSPTYEGFVISYKGLFPLHYSFESYMKDDHKPKDTTTMDDSTSDGDDNGRLMDDAIESPEKTAENENRFISSIVGTRMNRFSSGYFVTRRSLFGESYGTPLYGKRPYRYGLTYEETYDEYSCLEGDTFVSPCKKPNGFTNFLGNIMNMRDEAVLEREKAPLPHVAAPNEMLDSLFAQKEKQAD